MNKYLWRRIKYFLLGVAGFLLALLIWSVIEPYYLDREAVVAEIPLLSQSWQGKKIAVVSDFQIGMWMANTRTVAQSIDRIVAERPAAALIAGDFVYKPRDNLTPELDRVSQLVRPLVVAPRFEEILCVCLAGFRAMAMQITAFILIAALVLSIYQFALTADLS